MKKIILFSLFALCTAVCSAQSPNFFSTEDGQPVIEGAISNDNSASDNFQRASNWALLMSQGGDIEKDEAAGTITVKGSVQTNSAYNPFAGSYTDVLGYKITLTVKDERVSYLFNNLILSKNYTGFGTNSKQYILSDLMERVYGKEALINAVEESGMAKGDKKKEIKKINAEAESFGNSLAKIEKTINVKLNLLKEGLSK